MDWGRAIGKDQQLLRRIAALLLALAGHAERAAGRSAAVRWLVLWRLGPAEPAVRAFAADAGYALPPPILAGYAAARPSDSRDDAARLAATFRALAAAFFALSLLAARFALRRVRLQRDLAGPGSNCPNPGQLLRLIAATRPRYRDTS